MKMPGLRSRVRSPGSTSSGARAAGTSLLDGDLESGHESSASVNDESRPFLAGSQAPGSVEVESAPKKVYKDIPFVVAVKKTRACYVAFEQLLSDYTPAAIKWPYLRTRSKLKAYNFETQVTRDTFYLCCGGSMFILALLCYFALYYVHHFTCAWHRGLCTPWIQVLGPMSVYKQQSADGSRTELKYRNPRFPKQRQQWGNYKTTQRMDEMRDALCLTPEEASRTLALRFSSIDFEMGAVYDVAKDKHFDADCANVLPVLVIASRRTQPKVLKALHFESFNANVFQMAPFTHKPHGFISALSDSYIATLEDMRKDHCVSRQKFTSAKAPSELRRVVGWVVSAESLSQFYGTQLENLAEWCHCNNVTVLHFTAGNALIEEYNDKALNTKLSYKFPTLASYIAAREEISARIRTSFQFFPFGVRYVRFDSEFLDATSKNPYKDVYVSMVYTMLNISRSQPAAIEPESYAVSSIIDTRIADKNGMCFKKYDIYKHLRQMSKTQAFYQCESLYL